MPPASPSTVRLLKRRPEGEGEAPPSSVDDLVNHVESEEQYFTMLRHHPEAFAAPWLHGKKLLANFAAIVKDFWKRRA